MAASRLLASASQSCCSTSSPATDGAVPAVLHALAGRPVRVALMSSIGVTGSGGASRDLLDWKRRGERLLRVSGLPYTIVRPGWFDAGDGGEQHVDLRQGDRDDYGPVRRDHVADVLVQALRTPSALARTVPPQPRYERQSPVRAQVLPDANRLTVTAARRRRHPLPGPVPP